MKYSPLSFIKPLLIAHLRAYLLSRLGSCGIKKGITSVKSGQKTYQVGINFEGEKINPKGLPLQILAVVVDFKQHEYYLQECVWYSGP